MTEPVRDLAENEFAPAVTAHMAEWLGPPKGTIAEIFSEVVPLEILTFPPSGDRAFWVFMTLGMSSRAMHLPDPEDTGTFGRAELMIGLSPARAEAAMAASPSPQDWAPVKMLKSLARYPHSAGTFLAATQTVGLDGLGLDFGGAPFEAVLLLPPFSLPTEVVRFDLPNGERLNLYAVLPLRAGEFALLQDRGLDALLTLLNPTGIDETLDPQRPDVTDAPAKKGWKLW